MNAVDARRFRKFGMFAAVFEHSEERYAACSLVPLWNPNVDIMNDGVTDDLNCSGAAVSPHCAVICALPASPACASELPRIHCQSG